MVCDETITVRIPTMMMTRLTKSEKLSAVIDPEAGGVAVPEQHRGAAGADQADDGEAAERHPLAAAAERLGQHRRRGPPGVTQMTGMTASKELLNMISCPPRGMRTRVLAG